MAVFPGTLCGSMGPPGGTHPIPVPIKRESDRRQRPQTAFNQLHCSLTGVCVSIVVQRDSLLLRPEQEQQKKDEIKIRVAQGHN